jgi:hydrogenase large subunit
MEEYFDYSYQKRVPISDNKLIQSDPNGNHISSHHPWNKCSQRPTDKNSQAYSWGSSLTWRGHGFEVGAYSRLYLTAVAQKLPSSNYLTANGSSLEFSFPIIDSGEAVMQWHVPNIWNAFERNRARAYALSFSYSVTLENIDIAQRLIDSGETETHAEIRESNSGRKLGVGLWGASRGFLAHWAVIDDLLIENYQIAVPSRVNAGTRTPMLELGPLEKALLNTPIIESNFSKPENFTAIDIQRTIQSFDPCMSCSSHVLIKNSNKIVENVIDTCFPV